MTACDTKIFFMCPPSSEDHAYAPHFGTDRNDKADKIHDQRNDHQTVQAVNERILQNVDVEKLINGGGKNEQIRFPSENINGLRARVYFSVVEPIGKVYNLGQKEYQPSKRIVVEYSKNGVQAVFYLCESRQPE